MSKKVFTHSVDEIYDCFDAHAPIFLKAIVHYTVYFGCGRYVPNSAWGRKLRSLWRIIVHGALCITSIIGASSLSSNYSIQSRLAYILISIDWVLISAYSYIGVKRSNELYSLLNELECKCISEKGFFHATEMKVNIVHGNLFLSSNAGPVFPSLKTIKRDIHNKNDDSENEDKAASKTAEDEVISEEGFFYANVYTPCVCCIAIWLTVLLTMTIHNLTFGTPLAWAHLAFAILMCGDTVYAIVSIFRWINVAQHSIHTWAYAIVEVIDKEEASVLEGGGVVSDRRNFVRILDLLHDLHNTPMACLNQRWTLILALILIQLIIAAVANVAFLYAPDNPTPIGNIFTLILCLFILVMLIFLSGQVTESFIIAREILRRPRILGALKSLLGDCEVADMFLRFYFFEESPGLKLLGSTFSHYSSLGVMMTMFVGLTFSFGPSIAEAMA